MLISLICIDFQGQVSHRKRFLEEFSEEEHLPPKVPKPGKLVKLVELILISFLIVPVSILSRVVFWQR